MVLGGRRKNGKWERRALNVIQTEECASLISKD